MQSYFSAIQPHLQARVDIAVIPSNEQSVSQKSILSIGIDNLIFVRNLITNQQDRIDLNEDTNYVCLARGTKTNKCFLGTEKGTIEEFDIKTKQTRQIFHSEFRVNSITCSPNYRYLAAATQESKCILIDLQTLKVSKCRPGHDQSVANVFFSNNEKYLASIGKDKLLLIFSIQNFQQPLQMLRFKICRTESIDGQNLSGSFHSQLSILYSSGLANLQIFELLSSKWQHRTSSFIKHMSPILLVKTLKSYLLLTSCQKSLILWNNRNQEKLVVIDNFNLCKVIQANSTFFGVRNDGKLYQYQKVLKDQVTRNQIVQTHNQKMEIQSQGHKDVINFDDQEQDQGQDQQQQKLKDDISQKQQKFQLQKRSKADKIITAYPQNPISTSTSLFENSRYLITNTEGYLTQVIQSQSQTRIQLEHQNLAPKLLFINKQILFCDFNEDYLVYANETSFGLKFFNKEKELEAWEKGWWDVLAVTAANNYIAVANQTEIKLLDLTGNQLKTISFDRQLVAITAYLNLLAVVYHQSIPIWGAQCLTMQLFVVNHEKNQVLKCSSCHVPVKPKSQLKFFRFTKQGMILSQDNAGFIRIYNLQNNSWTSVIVEGIQDTRRLWLLGMQNYQLVYWKTAQFNPDPQVFPRLPLKRSRLGISVSTQAQQLQQYPYLLFNRFCLDNQKCRMRLWSHLSNAEQSNAHKQLNNSKDSNNSSKKTSDIYKQNKTARIPTQKQLIKHHNQLDYKFYSVVKYYLKSNLGLKALNSVKSLIRTLQAGKNLIDLFDDFKLRNLSVDLQKYYQEKVKQLQYETIQQLELNALKQQASKSIKPKSENPFKKNPKKNQYSSIPSLNNSQFSQQSNFDTFSEKSQYRPKQNVNAKVMVINTPHKQQISNPFLKKRSTQDDLNTRSKQIQEQIQRFGVKKKAEVKKSQVGPRKL